MQIRLLGIFRRHGRDLPRGPRTGVRISSARTSARSWRSSSPVSAERPLAAGRMPSQRSTPHQVFPAGGCMNAPYSRDRAAAPRRAPRSHRGGVEPSERKPMGPARPLQSRLFIRGRDLQRAFSPAAIVTLSNRIRPALAGVPPGPERRGLRRGRERGDRIPLGRGPIRAVAGVGS